jgi:hypothetical protein
MHGVNGFKTIPVRYHVSPRFIHGTAEHTFRCSDYFIPRDHHHGLVYHRGPMDLRSMGCTGLLNGRTSRVISYFRRRLYDEAIALGYVTVPSKSASYWLTQCTTRDLVDDIIAPYSLTSREALLMTSPGRQTYFGVI